MPRKLIAKLINPWRHLREAEAMIEELLSERNLTGWKLDDLRMTESAEIARLNDVIDRHLATISANQAEIRAIRAERLKDQEQIMRLEDRIRDTSIWLAEQAYGEPHERGTADEQGVPYAVEEEHQGAEIIAFPRVVH
jgi:hypothetical protein